MVRASTASVLLSNSSRPDRDFELAAGTKSRRRDKKKMKEHKNSQMSVSNFWIRAHAPALPCDWLNLRLASKTLNLVKAGTLCSVQSCR